MKKTLLHTVIATFVVALSLSSCLGDSSNSYETGNSLVYVGQTSEGYTKYGMSRELGQAFTSDYVKTLDVNRIYRMAFKVKLGSGGVILADYVNPVGDGLALARGRSSSYVPSGETVYLPGTEIFPTKLGVSFFMPYNKDQANDIWAFSYTAEGFDDDYEKDDSGNYVNIDFYAYIEGANQNLPVEGGTATKPLDGNQAIVNLYMTRKASAPVIEETKRKTQSREFTIDMSELRSHFESKVTHEEGVYYTPVAIQFRFTTEDSSKKQTEESIGKLDLSQNVEYYMLLDNPKKPS